MRALGPLAALFLAGCVAIVFPQGETLKLETAANAPVTLGTYAFWREDCTPLAVEIETTQVPERGIIDIVEADYVVPRTVPEGAPGGCEGRTVTGKTLSYVPDSDWRGTDRLSLIARGGGQAVSDSFLVTVR